MTSPDTPAAASGVAAFTPSPALIRLAEAVFVAIAHELHVRPIVEAYQRESLARHRFKVAAMFGNQSLPPEHNSVILDPKYAWLMSESDFAIYNAECHAARDAHALRVESPEKCPLLVAEHMRFTAETAFLEMLGEETGLVQLQFATISGDLRKEAVDLGLRLLAPHVRSGDAILQGLLNREDSTAATGGIPTQEKN